MPSLILHALLGIILYFLLVLLAIGLITAAVVGLLIAYAFLAEWWIRWRHPRKRGWGHG